MATSPRTLVEMQKYFEGSVLKDDEIEFLTNKVKTAEAVLVNDTNILNCSIDSLDQSTKFLPDIKNRLKFDPSSSLIGESTVGGEETLLVRDDNDDGFPGMTTKSPFKTS